MPTVGKAGMTNQAKFQDGEEAERIFTALLDSLILSVAVWNLALLILFHLKHDCSGQQTVEQRAKCWKMNRINDSLSDIQIKIPSATTDSLCQLCHSHCKSYRPPTSQQAASTLEERYGRVSNVFGGCLRVKTLMCQLRPVISSI